MVQRTKIIDNTWYQRTTGAALRTGAGGVVVRGDEGGAVYIAFVREKGSPFLFLPKGGQEEGESLERTAVREINEETGIQRLQLIRKLTILGRLGLTKDYWKSTHYYLFRTDQIHGVPMDVNHDYHLWWFPLEAPAPFFWPEQKQLINDFRQEISDAAKK